MNTLKAKRGPKKVAIYLRVSTDDQVEKYGPKIQKEAILNLIESRKYTDEPFIFAGEEYVYFDNGISGTIPPDERPALARLKEEITFSNPENRPFDVVIVYRIDRFARKLKVLHEIIDFFEESEIKFVSVTENIDTTTPFGRAILSIIGVIAELEIETIKQRTQAGREVSAHSGTYMGNAPVYGYKKREDKKLSIIREEAEGVKTIFDLYVNKKYGIGKIAKYLQDHKLLSPESSTIKNKKREGTSKKQNSPFHWNDLSVRRILKNELYTGIYYYAKSKKGKKLPKEEWKKSDYSMPIIIDLLTFEKAQKILEKSKTINISSRKRPEPYYLSGLLTCDACFHLKGNNGHRNNWNGVPKLMKGNNKYAYYYVCSRKSHSKYNTKCKTLPLPAKEIEDFVIENCLKLISNPLAVYKHQQTLSSSKTEIKKLHNQQEKINGLISGIPNRKRQLSIQHEHGLISPKELKERTQEINNPELLYRNELRDIYEKIAQNNISDGYLKTLELFSEKYQNVLKKVSGNKELVEEVIHMLVDEIVIYSRDKKNTDIIAGPKKDGQEVPFRLSMRLKLPQDILAEISSQEHLINPTIEKTSESTDVSSSVSNTSRGR